MKTKYLLFVAVAAIVTAGCSAVEEPRSASDPTTVRKDFSTVLTKTELSEGNTVIWEADDEISVFDGVSNREFNIKGTPSGSSATFSGEVASGSTEFYAVYPYSAENALNGNTITASVPSSQNVKEGSFASGASVAAAWTDASSFIFNNATALIKFHFGAEMTGVTKVVFSGNSGEKVAGAMEMVWDGSAFSVVPASSAVATVSLEGNFEVGKDYYLAFIPQNFENGISLTFTKDGNDFVKSNTAALSTISGKIYPLVGETTLAASFVFDDEQDYTFDYGQTKTINITCKNVDLANTSLTLPAGWSYSDLTVTSVKITAPTQVVVSSNEASDETYKPLGTVSGTLSAESGAQSTISGPSVRLRGINSSEEFNEFRTHYQNGPNSFSASGVSYNRRLTDCADYLVCGEITLNDDISASPENSDYKYYILHHIEHNLNGNGKTFTMSVDHNESPIGFCQTIFGTVKVHDLKLAGTINWTYSAAESTAGCCGGFVAQSQDNTVSLTLENIENSVNINWTSASTADPTKNHVVGGFIGVWTGKPVTFVNCTYSGTITKNCRNLATAGFVAWNASTSQSKFDGCVFSGKIDDTATTSKSEWITDTLLEFIGGFVGASDNQAAALIEIKGCESKGTIKIDGGARNVGGFVGKGTNPLTFSDNGDGKHCVFSGTIDYTETDDIVYGGSTQQFVYALIGGFVAWNNGQTANTMQNCICSADSKIKVSGTVNLIGGLIAKNDAAIAPFKGNKFEGVIDYTASKYITGSAERVGGLIAHKGGAKGTIDSCESNGTIYIRKGANTVGGFFGIEPLADTFTSCKFGGTIDYTSYSTNNGGSIGGFVGVGSGASVEYKFNNCEVTSTAVIKTTGYITSLGGFAGNSGSSAATKATFTDCNYKGSITIDAIVAAGNKRIGGFVGDAARQVSLTNCTNSGFMVLHQGNVTPTNPTNFGFGGILGRTTAQSGSTNTMKCDMTGCTFSGTMTVYNSPMASSAYGYGTMIGTNAGYGVTTIDGVASGTTNASVNYGTTSVRFLTE